MTPKRARLVASLLVIAGLAVVAIGVAQIYRPAGVIVAGLAAVLSGLYLIDDGEDVREPSATRPNPDRHR